MRVHIGYRISNQFYKLAFPVYRPIYRAFKAYVDRAERHLLSRHLTAGSVVVDAGANIGIYSEFLSNCIRPGGVVHSFEPADWKSTRLNSSHTEQSRMPSSA